MVKTQEKSSVNNISTADLRKGLGDIFNRVQYTGARYTVNRKGKAIGAIVPVEFAQEIETLRSKQGSANSKLLGMLEKRRGSDSGLSDEETMKIATEEINSVRVERAKKIKS